MLANEPLAKLQAISVQDSDTKILSNVSLSLTSGERVAVLGKSGAGKSSLISVLAGNRPTTEGTAWLLGQQLESISSRRVRRIKRQIGQIPQNYVLLDDLSALENVLQGLLPQKSLPRVGVRSYTSGERKRAIEIMASLAIEELSSTHTGLLSGGQRQRVAVARALIGHPTIVLADEPTSALDGVSAQNVLSAIDKYSAANSLVVSAFHQVELAFEWATRIVVISQGRLVLDAPKDVADFKEVLRLLGD